MPLFAHESGTFWNIQTIYITLNSCCDKKSDIHKTKLSANLFIILGYVNNYGKKRYLLKLWHAAAL